MIGRFTLALAVVLLLVTGNSSNAQQPAPQAAAADRLLQVNLGVLGTGRIVEGSSVGSVGLFHSDLATVVAGSPEAERYARVFARNQAIGRPLVLLGSAAIIGGFAAYVARAGQLGVGGREAAAIGLGTGVALYGANRLIVSQRALATALEVFNRDRQR